MDYSTEQRRQLAAKGQAMPGGRFPVANRADLENAIRAVGRANGSHDTVRAYIIRRARALGLTNLIPSNWTSSGSN